MEKILYEIVLLRATGLFLNTISYYEENKASLTDDSIAFVAVLEVFKATVEYRDIGLIKKYAALVAVKEPGLPSIQEYL